MATSGTINNTFRTGYAVRIVWSVSSQSVANNTSTVTASVQLVSLGASYTINSSATKSGTLTINGTKYSYSFSAALAGNQTKTIYKKTVTITHNANGSKSCAFACNAGIAVTLGSTYYSSVSASGSGVFNTIPRASDFTITTPTVEINGGNAVAINISRASSAFTHTMRVSFAGYYRDITGLTTSGSWVIFSTWLNGMPNATSGTVTITLTTYSGSTKIGNAISKTLKVTVPASIKPSISSVSLSEAVSGLAAKFGAYVQNKSKVAVSVASAGAYSSTINSIKTVILGVTYTGAKFTSGFLTSNGSVAVSTTVTDSRGRTTTANNNITVLAYSRINISNFKANRGTASGTFDDNGAYLVADINFSVPTVGNKNDKLYSLQYKEAAATIWNTVQTGNIYTYNASVTSSAAILSTEKQYKVRLVVTDYFGSATSNEVNIGTAFTLMDFHSLGKGMAFGKVAEIENIVDFGLKAKFNNGEVPNGAIPLASGANLNNLTGAGCFLIPDTNISATILSKPPAVGSSTALVENLIGGNAGQVIQKYTNTSKDNHYVYQRAYYANSWGDWHKICATGKILWTGGLYMMAEHRATLEEKISEQLHGIIIVFSRYLDGAAQDTNFNSFFISRTLVKEKSGVGHSFILNAGNNFGVIGAKYLYINDTTVIGHASNGLTGTGASGITFANNAFVMRYVIGV